MWGEVGRQHEEEEPAKKQKWLEWWQVPWTAIVTEAGREKLMKGDLASLKCL